MKRLTSSDLVVTGILDLLLADKIQPGGKLPSIPIIAKLVGTSVISAREALKKLEAVGLISVNHGKGILLLPGAPVIEDLLEARMAMESATAGLAAARIDGPGIEMLSRLVAELERCKDSDLLRYSKVDAQFHLGIAKVAGNRFLLKALENISDLLQYQQQQLARVSVLMDTVTSQHQHTEIFEAIRQKNVNLAREAMVRHLSEVTRLWKDELRKHVPPETG